MKRFCLLLTLFLILIEAKTIKTIFSSKRFLEFGNLNVLPLITIKKIKDVILWFLIL